MLSVNTMTSMGFKGRSKKQLTTPMRSAVTSTTRIETYTILRVDEVCFGSA
jgi:hypothetical protein